MMKKFESFLKNKKAKYKVVSHRKVYTAWDSSATQHINIKTVAKTLLVKADNDYFFVVLSANKKLDINKLKKIINVWRVKEAKTLDNIRTATTKASAFAKASADRQKLLKAQKIKKISLCSENIVKKKIVGKEGAMAPFGSFYGYKTFVDSLLLKQKKINLNAGSFTESLEMTPANYKKVEEPIVGSFGK
ncbi:MAG: YbaK/EbsC family protein [Patescibacteria group bacterium]|jgi:prolyl-tRNA editing enzyme YbaK/EbsC (Cys-tRNA(Pro) deacylase)